MSKVVAWIGAALVLLLATTTTQAGTRHYYYTDPQGTVLAKTDAAGNIVETADYRSYGARVLGTVTNGPGYTGHVNDADSGLVYMQARYYDPGTGGFLSTDPVASFAGERYVYAKNNPLRFIDPDGRLAGIASDGRGDYYWDHFGRRVSCNFCLEKSVGEKLKRNAKWFARSIKANVGVRLGLNAKVKLGKLARMEIGTGYIGESGELNALMEYAQLYEGKGPSLAFQVGRLKLGGESGGWETRTDISLSGGMSLRESHTKPFFLASVESARDYSLNRGVVAIEANPLILHGEVSVDISSMAISIFYWGDSDMDPAE
jgi:RHS repeat-associated protein